jgi:hypothetical protein
MNHEHNIEWLKRRMEEYRSARNGMGEVVEDLDEIGKLGSGFVSIDDLEEVDIGQDGMVWLTYIIANILSVEKAEICGVLWEFSDCFAWSYTEMPGLSQDMVEHQLLIKQGFRPYKQTAKNFNPDVVSKVKEEVDRLLQAGFIWPCRYAEWVSNVVLAKKKNTGKIRVCVDFRNLNRVTPKDEYPMPVADILINSASGNRVISFLDGNAGYNQIFMAEGDITKTAFRCLGFVGLFEFVVMTFGLKNAGATYQRAMNLIFHDLLGLILEVYIDDVVMKAAGFQHHLANM